MTINKEQIEKTLKEYFKDYPAQQVGIDCSILAQRIAEDYQPKTTSTDIEELKKRFEDKFTYIDDDGEKNFLIGYDTIKKNNFDLVEDVWNFFLPHLSNKSELKKEAYEQGVKDEANRWINQPANEHDKRIKKEAVMRFVKWYNDIPDYAIDAKIDMEEVNKYLSSNEKEEQNG